MKKILIVLCCVFLVACSKSSNALKDISKSINDCNGYYLDGTLEVMNGEDSSFYDVKVSFKKENLFKVSLINQINNHEQIILRNSDGVYVNTHNSTKQKLKVILDVSTLLQKNKIKYLNKYFYYG